MCLISLLLSTHLSGYGGGRSDDPDYDPWGHETDYSNRNDEIEPRLDPFGEPYDEDPFAVPPMSIYENETPMVSASRPV